MEMVVEEALEVEVATVRRCSDGIIEVIIKQGARIQEEEILEVLDAQTKLTNMVVAVLVDARGAAEMSRRAQERTANSPINDVTAATAILVESPVSTFLGNFFLRFARPPYPTRLFRDADEARAWLLESLEARLGD